MLKIKNYPLAKVTYYQQLGLKCKAKVNIINKYKPPSEVKGKGNSKISVPFLYCKAKEELYVISVNLYNHKDGQFYVVENSKGERFTVDDSKVELIPLVKKKFSLDDI